MTPDNNITSPYIYNLGTSVAAPLVTGTIGLMLGVDANPCLYPIEIESILKLTSVRNDLLPLNLPYQGQLGAGRLDSFAAVDMALDMALPTGTVEVKDRFINRWDYVLKTSPYEILMSNNTVINNATIDFTARNNITVLSGDYAPTIGSIGFIELNINSINNSCNTPIQNRSYANSSNSILPNKIQIKLYPNPNKGSFSISLIDKEVKDLSVSVFDIFGKLVYQTKANQSEFELNISNLPRGIYLVKLSSNSINETLKFIRE